MMSKAELKKLFEKTSFRAGEAKWEDLEIVDDHIYVPQCSHLGDTLISLDDTYEGSGEDCFFIQELIRFYKEEILKENEVDG